MFGGTHKIHIIEDEYSISCPEKRKLYRYKIYACQTGSFLTNTLSGYIETAFAIESESDKQRPLLNITPVVVWFKNQKG